MRSYIVQSGDTLGQIAARFATTVSALASLNSIANPNLIRVGQQLLIPDGGSIGGDAGENNGGNAFQRNPSFGHVFPVQGFSGQVQLHHGSHIGASDLFAAHGTPVVAICSGRVSLVTTAPPNRFGGNSVQIEGDDGLSYYYAHGDRNPQTREGDHVITGQFLFGVGETGNAAGTGAHLHIGIGHGIQDGVGPAGGAGIGFNAVELLRSALSGAMSAVRFPRTGISRRRYQVFNTGHLGLRVREHPSHSAAILAAFPDGELMDGEDTVVQAEGRLWRRVLTPVDGFAADEFLLPVQVDTNGGGATPRGILTVEQLFALVRRHGAAADLDKIMVAAALAESGGNTEAVGDGGHAVGLWQMHDLGLGHGMNREDRHDPDKACAAMSREFRRVFAESNVSGAPREKVAVRTYVFTERPAGFPSLESDAATRFLAEFARL
ncbi:MAG: LysM peptidoglycan-binding domain-containing protein [Chloroflexota bacterium]